MSDDDVISRPPAPVARVATPALNKALAAAQKRAEAVEKVATNTFHKYNYASAEAIIEDSLVLKARPTPAQNAITTYMNIDIHAAAT